MGRMGDIGIEIGIGIGQNGVSGNDDVVDKMNADVIVVCTGYTSDWSWLDLKTDRASDSPFSSSSSSLFNSSLLPLNSNTSLSSSLSQYSKSTSNSSSNSYLCDKNNGLSTYAKTQCRNPDKCNDGLYFIGYDPGDALIP